ncbi:hypothetical protein FACS1894191_2000 [Clostridia bacterium]|nr:hypothetical protein FACS1894191_2000 [Clostridia bacterium]
MRAIQFESTVEGGVIHIPEQYRKEINPGTRVTVLADIPLKIAVKPRAEARRLTRDDFKAFRIDTSNWKFDREEANERR